ncbi:MAG: YjbH domain-containing protein, partial [Gemmobacter sp.]
MMTGRKATGRGIVLAAAIAAAGPAAAQPLSFPSLAPAAEPRVLTRPTRNVYGVTGLIDMPSGEMQREGDFSISATGFGPFTRTAITYQITPWMQGSFRYSGVAGLRLAGFGPNDVYYDRSFDLRLRVIREGQWRPSVVIGFQDFIGTGNFSSEYIVATKHIVPRVKVTAGLGWGRLGTVDPIITTGTRPRPGTPTGGTPNFGQWFRGPAALFGGIEWQPTDKLGFKVEYSSDGYVLESQRQAIFARKSQVNFAVEYEVQPGIRLGAQYLYGNRLGLSASIALNTRDRAGGNVLYGPGALPVAVRPARAAAPQAWGTSWADTPGAAAGLRKPLEDALGAEGIALVALAVTAGRAEVRIANRRYDAAAQAVGRTARIMARVLPASVEQFDIVTVEGQVAASKVTFRRSDL